MRTMLSKTSGVILLSATSVAKTASAGISLAPSGAESAKVKGSKGAAIRDNETDKEFVCGDERISSRRACRLGAVEKETMRLEKRSRKFSLSMRGVRCGLENIA